MAEPAKVIPFDTNGKNHNRQGIEWKHTHQVCKLLQENISSYIRTGGKISRIASKTGLGSRTISKIGYGETKEPRTTTVLVLLRHFGYKVMIS